MGSFCKPSPATTTQTQTYQADPNVAAAGNEALDMARNAAGQPFQMPAAPVAGLNPFQQQAFGQIQGIQGGLQPYFDRASADLTRSASPISESDIQGYMNPYSDAVLANMKKYIFDPQRRDTMGRGQQAAGGIGAERLALTSQNLDKTQADALAGAMAGFYTPAMAQAQRSKEMAMASASGWANLGLQNQSGNLQGIQALLGAGNQQQGQTQAELMSPYQQRLAEIAYPYQNAQFLAGITGGMAPVFRGTQTGTTVQQPSQPSLMNQIIGAGTAAAGAYFGIPGASSLFGGGGGSQYDRSNPNNNYAAFGPTYFAKGGSVSPYDFAEGYEDGGFADRWAAVPDAIDSGEFDPRGINNNPSAYGMDPPPEGPSNPFSSIPAGGGFKPPSMAMPVSATGYDMFNDPGVGGPKPVPTETIRPPTALTVNDSKRLPLPRPRPQIEEPPPPPQRQPLREESTPDPSIMMPRELMPYPDSTERDWGQKLTRSPWMSLVTAGAKMMQSTKGGIGGLGEGLEAGAKTLGEQRESLRSEEQINQRANLLWQNAKQELNKYTKMTPYQKALVDRAKFRPTGMTTQEGHPVLFNERDGTSVNGITGAEIPEGTKLVGRPGAASRIPPLQSNIEYFIANGMATDRNDALRKIKQTAGDRNSFGRLVQIQERILQGDINWMYKPSDERHAEARRIARELQREAETLAGE